MLAFVTAAHAQEPTWQACRPKALPMEASALFDRPLPPLRPARGLATPDQTSSGHRLVVEPGSWWLDGAVVTELGKLDAVVVAVSRDLPAPEVERLFQALKASGATVWSVADAAGRIPAGSRSPEWLPPVPRGGVDAPEGAPPGTVAEWNKLLSQCGPGKELVAPGGDCARIDALWKAVTDNPRCLLPPRLVRTVREPVGAGTPAGIAVEPLPIDPTHDAWLRPDQTWADLEPFAGWAHVGAAPWGDGLPDAGEALILRDRITPTWPDDVPKKAKDLHGTCSVRLVIEPDGAPSTVEVTGCDAPFQASVEAALPQWRWHPPVLGGFVRRVETRLSFVFEGGAPAALRED